MINVTKSFMPPINEYEEYLNNLWESKYLTNEGPLVNKLGKSLKEYLNVKYINLVTNGTVALELAIKALDIEGGEIITTPFTFVATVTSIIWQNCKPVFVDIDKNTLCINTKKIEEAITTNTKAIMAVHVFGYPCDIEEIQKIANKYNLKVIYDGSHAFGCRYNNKSLLEYGDITTCSFHATKLFHTIEGGACITNNNDIDKKIQSLKMFGKDENGDYSDIGTNAKMTEINAAMGLANLKYIEKIILERKELNNLYDELLKGRVKRPTIPENLEYNYIYYPIILKDEEETLKIIEKLNKREIYPRRYFYPSLNTLEYVEDKKECPISEDISKRILCLPLYNGLTKEQVKEICNIIKY